MSLTTIKHYSLDNRSLTGTLAGFQLEIIRGENACSANESHRSEAYEIFFIEKGEGRYQVDFHEFSIKDAGVFCLSPGQVFSVESENLISGCRISFNREFYCVETHGKEIACNGVLFNNVHKATFIQLDRDEVPAFRFIVDKMEEEFKHPGKAHSDILETYLRMFLIEALRKHDDRTSSHIDNGKNQLVGDFIANVEKYFRVKHSVSEYADMLFVSPKSLAKRLNAEGYKTPTEVIRDRIVLEAKRDLRYTRKSVKEIAYDLGFEDPGYFTRYFKKSTSISPADYRKSYSVA